MMTEEVAECYRSYSINAREHWGPINMILESSISAWRELVYPPPGLPTSIHSFRSVASVGSEDGFSKGGQSSMRSSNDGYP